MNFVDLAHELLAHIRTLAQQPLVIVVDFLNLPLHAARRVARGTQEFRLATASPIWQSGLMYCNRLQG